MSVGLFRIWVELPRKARSRSLGGPRKATRFSADPMTRAVFPRRPEHQVRRYAIFDEIAGGGMETVHSARLVGSGRFFRLLAAKRIYRPFSAGSFIRLVAIATSFAFGGCSYDFGKFAVEHDAGAGSGGTSGATGGTSLASGGTSASTATGGSSFADSGAGGSELTDTGSGGSMARDSGAGGSEPTDTGPGGSMAPDSGSGGSMARDSGSGGSMAPDSGSGGSTASDSGAGGSMARDSGAGGSTAQDTGGNAGSCGGVAYGGICWYLGPSGSTCQQVCASHGKPAPEAATYVGTTGQGGSLADCKTLFGLLGVKGQPESGTRSDGMGFGCHMFQDSSLWWLSSPNYSASAGSPVVQVVCGCTQ